MVIYVQWGCRIKMGKLSTRVSLIWALSYGFSTADKMIQIWKLHREDVPSSWLSG